MSRFVRRLWLATFLLVASNAWAIGLGDITLKSALNEPLRAEIDLISATPEELAALAVILATPETFERYGLDRPGYLNDIRFEIVESGRLDGNYVSVTSRQPMTEPFLTFLVEASWARGRLLREYTVLLDPPTFAPPQPQREAVTAPQRAEPRDSGRIERPAPAPAREPAPQPRQAPVTQAPRSAEPEPQPEPEYVPPQPPADEPDDVYQPAPEPAYEPAPYSTASGDDYRVARNQTLWGIARDVRPDSRLTINQVMLAIFEANPEAFGGNINILKAGATLRIPSADEVFMIDRRDAFNEAKRQNEDWDGSASTSDDTTDAYEPYTPEPEPAAPAEDDSSSLTLVPADEDDVGLGTGEEPADTDATVSRENEILDRLDAIEAEEIPTEPALIDIRNDELANLRRELAEIRGEEYIPPVDDSADAAEEMPADGVDPFVDVADEPADDMVAEDGAAEDAADDPAADAADEPAAEEASPPPARVIRSEPEPGIVDTIMNLLKSFWMVIVGVVVAVAGILFWFLRGRGGDDEGSGVWEPLDRDDAPVDLGGSDTETQSIPPPEVGEETIVVEEVPSPADTMVDTVEVEAPEIPGMEFTSEPEPVASDDTIETDPLEDTFSSETAVNLDQSDPIAEADFHMAYGLYDQAADLINGALQADPNDQDLLTKLCEIYFVWGNRDAFVDAAQRVKNVVEGGDSADWDKIVIMGQQIAGDSELFAGAGVAGATKEVDLTFDAGADDGGDLDMVFDAEESSDGGEEGSIDFMFDGDDAGAAEVDENLEITQQTPTVEASMDEPTAEMPAVEATAEMPTIEQPVDEGTAALPAIDEALGDALEASGQDSDATAEIDLDDLGLDLDALDQAADSLDDDMEITGSHEALEDTGVNEALTDLDETGKNEQFDPTATGIHSKLAGDELNFDLDTTGVQDTIEAPLGDESDTDVGLDVDILEATGKTQVLSEDMKVETINEPGPAISDDAETLLASNFGEGDDDDADYTPTEVIGDNDATMLAPSPTEEDFDFAKTEALPADTYDADATAETPALASTDMDLDLDDLTAALDLSEAGDTVEMPRDDATVEQPRPPIGDDATAEMPSLGFGDDDDLSEARTMTEVGTKLDLARAYVDMGDPGGARSILEEVLDEGDDDQRKQAQDLLDSLPE